MTTPDAGTSPLQALPDDVLRRLLAGVPRLDHGATAAACRAFRAEFDKWTVELNVPSEFWYFPVQDACNHKGRVVVFLQSGTTSVRLAPGHWYLVDLCEDANELVHDNHNGNRYVAESALLG